MARPTNHQDDDASSGILWVLMILFLGGGLWLLLGKPGHQGNPEKTSMSSQHPPSQALKGVPKEALDEVDYQLKTGDLRARAKSEEMRRDNEVHKTPLHGAPSKNVTNPTHDWGVRTTPENSVSGVMEDLEEPNPRNPSPAYEIDSNLAKEEYENRYDQMYQKQFVKEFKRKAAEDGWDVHLDDDLNVIGLRPNDPQKPLRFPQSEGKSSGSGQGASH